MKKLLLALLLCSGPCFGQTLLPITGIGALGTINGTGNLVATTSPTLVTPVLGVAGGTSLSLSAAGSLSVPTLTFSNCGTTPTACGIFAPVDGLEVVVDGGKVLDYNVTIGNTWFTALALQVSGGLSSGLQGVSNGSLALVGVTSGSSVFTVSATGQTVTLNNSLVIGAAITSSGAVADSGYSYQTPTTGFSITIGNSVYHLILDPAGTLATGTITMPAAPIDGQFVDVRFSQIVTTLTVSANVSQSIKGNPTSAAVGSQFGCIYRAGNTTWYC